MIDCLILGDSLGEGVSMMRHECVARVKHGINSTNFNRKWPGPYKTEVAVISLGSNDDAKVNTRANIEALRANVSATKVFWIVPNIKDDKRAIVESVAREHGDHLIDARKYPVSPDGVHPTMAGYKGIAALAK
jgi:lysophospholipase L1-like esterase